MNNFERIKTMSLSELYDFLSMGSWCPVHVDKVECPDDMTCDECLRKWLMQEVDNDE